MTRSSNTLRLYLIVSIAAAAFVVAAAPAKTSQTSPDGPFTRAELLAYLRSIPGYQDLSVPDNVRKEAHDKLTRLIKQRGVDFVYDMFKFDKELHDAGISPASMASMAANYRKPAPQSRATPAPPSPVRTPAPPDGPGNQGATVDPASSAKPFTRAELLAYLRSIPKSQDPSVPYQTRKEAHDKLTRLIKQRGVDFVQPRGSFDRDFYEAGISSLSSIAIWENYRAPGKPSPGAVASDRAFFARRWAMGISGMSTRYDRQGSAVGRTDQLVGAAGGFLEIAPNGTYVWQYDRSSPEMRGRWRAATEQELQTEAGQGIVLLRGYDNGDWLVTRRVSERPGEYITVCHVAARYRYFIGSR